MSLLFRNSRSLLSSSRGAARLAKQTRRAVVVPRRLSYGLAAQRAASPQQQQRRRRQQEEEDRALLGASLLSELAEERKQERAAAELFEREVLTVEAGEDVQPEQLRRLLDDEVSVLRVRGFVPKRLCKQLTTFFWGPNAKREPYTHEIYEDEVQADGSVKQVPKLLYFGVDRVGVPYNSTYGKGENSPEVLRYFREALRTMRGIRRAASPFPSPMDSLRLMFDELHPEGARLGSDKGRKMFCGIGRLMDAAVSEQSEEQPHFDALPTVTDADSVLNIHQQFAANTYLQVPESGGGALEIWPVPPLAYDAICDVDATDDLRAVLPPSIKVEPEQGDLLLFSTRRPHAITAFKEGTRTSMQCFFGRKKGGPIVMWN